MDAKWLQVGPNVNYRRAELASLSAELALEPYGRAYSGKSEHHPGLIPIPTF